MEKDSIATTVTGKMVQPTLNTVLNELPMHQNWYLRGIVNAFLPQFMNPLETKITERSLNGESLAMLRGVAESFYPDLEEGKTAPLDYDMINEKYGLKNIFAAGTFDVDTFGDEVKMSLGQFMVARENGKYVLYDTYDFPEVGNWKEFSELETAGDYAQQVVEQGGSGAAYFTARFFAERFMNESRDDNLKVRIELPEDDEVVRTDYDNEATGENFVFRGPMTTLRKQIWDKFTGADDVPSPTRRPAMVKVTAG